MNSQRESRGESQRKPTSTSSVSPKQAKSGRKVDCDFHPRQSPPFPPQPPPARETIEESLQQQQLPQQSSFVQPFYSNTSAYDDSDGSDGSIVFSQQTPPAQYEISKRLTGQNQPAGRHDRFPSFDSVQSTGSFRVLPNSGASVPQRLPTAPQFLSYEQRRQQRRQAEQPDFNQNGSGYQRGRVGNAPLPMDPYSQYQQQQVYYQEQQQIQAQLMAAAAATQMGSPQQYVSAQQMHHMYGGYVGYGGYQTNMYDQRHRPPTPPKYRRGGSRPPQVPSQGYYSVSSQPPQHQHSNYRGPHSRGRSSSDSFRGRVFSEVSAGNFPRAAGPTSTSPKLMSAAPPPTHVRADSAGSISSMGSVGSKGMAMGDRRDEKIDQRNETGERRRGEIVSGMHRGHDDRLILGVPVPAASGPESSPVPPGSTHTKQDSSGGSSVGHSRQDSVSSFLSGIWNWSPTLGGSKEMTVEEFHRRNQDFLQREGKRQQQKPSNAFPSPKQTHHRRSSKGGPPNSRGAHRPPLASIEDDYWDDSTLGRSEDAGRGRKSIGPLSSSSNTSNTDPPPPPPINNAAGEASASSSFLSSSDEVEDDERTALLPPSGISTGEGSNSLHRARRWYTEESQVQRPAAHSRRQERRSVRSPASSGRSGRRVGDNNSESLDGGRSVGNRGGRKSARKKKLRRGRSSRRSGRTARQIIGNEEFSDSEDSLLSSDSSDFDYRQWTKKRVRMLEKERVKLIAQWKAEAKLEAEEAKRKEEANRWHRKLWRCCESSFADLFAWFFRFLALAETFVANLPLTIGAVALAVVTLGVVWYKFACENLDSCQPVHFHSAQCSFPEFPGCFDCDPSARFYRIAVSFHYACSIIAGVLALSFVLKVMMATRVVLDEMSSPTTASPAGLICMTAVCVFAGRGWVGQLLVSAAAGVHLVLVTWFIYMALAYHILPDPSWFPNSVGIGLSAVKTWLYYPMAGHLLMAISLSLNFFFFPISLIRVTLSRKISAPVAWIQMSAPSISLYALTIMAQPSFIEEHPDVTKFQRVHRLIYLPCMSLLFALTLIGMVSSVQSLIVRWDEFKKKPFSPAHAAFCFPTLAHANAIQAYRGAINSFSDGPEGSAWRIALYTYWVVVLVGGTVATLVITAKFLYRLPSWTNVDVADEEEPPAPYRTVLTLQDIITTGETLMQPFVSPAILQANETGALIRLPRGRDGVGRYVRTRRLPALGFEPTMNSREMQEERELLLDWVGKNAPRRRKRTLSVPGIDFNYGYGDFGHGNQGIYGENDSSRSLGHSRGLSFQPEHKAHWKPY